MTRRSGRHPEAVGIRVRLTDDALDDLHSFIRWGGPSSGWKRHLLAIRLAEIDLETGVRVPVA